MASYKFCGISIISIKTDVSYVPVFFYTIISTSHYINRRADQQFSYKLCRSKRELSTRTGLLRRIELSPISLADDLIDLQFDFSDNNRVCDCSGHNVCGPEHLNQLIKPVNNRSQLPADIVTATKWPLAQLRCIPTESYGGYVTSVRMHVDAWLAHLHRNCRATHDELPDGGVPSQRHRMQHYTSTNHQCSRKSLGYIQQ